MKKRGKKGLFSAVVGAAVAKLPGMRKTHARDANSEMLGRPSLRPAKRSVNGIAEARAPLQAGKVDKGADPFQKISSRDANLEAHIGFDISNAGLTQKYTSSSADKNRAEHGPNNTADLERWMASVVANFTPQELKEGVSVLDKASDEAKRQYRDEEVIRLCRRAVEYLDALHTVEINLPAWIDQAYAKQLRQSALAYDRLASARKEQDDAEAARYWAQGSQCLEQLLAHIPEQPEWVIGLHQKMARQGALACDRLASARKEQDDAEAARYWAQGSQCLEQLLAHIPEQPEWVIGLHQKMARQGALACDRLASA